MYNMLRARFHASLLILSWWRLVTYDSRIKHVAHDVGANLRLPQEWTGENDLTVTYKIVFQTYMIVGTYGMIKKNSVNIAKR